MMHISNFRPVKRVGDVLEIFARVQEQVPAKLLLVGEGPELPKIQCRINELGLGSKVHFLGKQDEIAHVISMADVLLLPSEKESFGLVALEAMACGVPTVGSTAGGIPELVTHGETGFWLQSETRIRWLSMCLIYVRMKPLANGCARLACSVPKRCFAMN